MNFGHILLQYLLGIFSHQGRACAYTYFGELEAFLLRSAPFIAGALWTRQLTSPKKHFNALHIARR